VAQSGSKLAEQGWGFRSCRGPARWRPIWGCGRFVKCANIRQGEADGSYRGFSRLADGSRIRSVGATIPDGGDGQNRNKKEGLGPPSESQKTAEGRARDVQASSDQTRSVLTNFSYRSGLSQRLGFVSTVRTRLCGAIQTPRLISTRVGPTGLRRCASPPPDTTRVRPRRAVFFSGAAVWRDEEDHRPAGGVYQAILRQAASRCPGIAYRATQKTRVFGFRFYRGRTAACSGGGGNVRVRGLPGSSTF